MAFKEAHRRDTVRKKEAGRKRTRERERQRDEQAYGEKVRQCIDEG